MRRGNNRLSTLSEIYAYFRKNQTPITFLSPTPYNLLGLGRWINKFDHVNYFDSFDGTHPKITVPREHGPHEFRSIEDVNNYLLRHKEVRAHLKKIGASKLGNDAGIASVPNVIGKATSWSSLKKLALKEKLGTDLVVQLPYGDSGRTTFFIKTEEDWTKWSDKVAGRELKVMRRINHLPGTLEAVATRHGTLVGPMQLDITGFSELTPYKGGWCGNDVFTRGYAKERRTVRTMTSKLGNRLYKEGYRGAFCIDFLIHTDTHDVYLGEINPRISGASPLTNLITSTYGGCPIFLFHMLEYMDIDWELDLNKVQDRWNEFDTWSQLVLKYPKDEVGLITKAPASGIWRMDDKGEITLVRQSIDWSLVSGEDEAFYLRVYTAGDYRYHGADMGILVSRGRMQTDDRRLVPRAEAWAKAIHARFETVPIPTTAPAVVPDPDSVQKMF